MPEHTYRRRLGEVQAAMSQARRRRMLAAASIAAAAALFLALAVLRARNHDSLWWPALAIPAGLASARQYGRHRRNEYRLWRLKRYYEQGAERIRGRWTNAPHTGEDVDDPAHTYARDLDVFGKGSLFQLLSTARSGIGRRGLANYLLEAPFEETRARQEAVRELRDRADLRESLALLGPFEFSESNWVLFAGWLAAPVVRVRSFLRVAFLVTSGTLACLVVLGALGLLSWLSIVKLAAPLVVFHAAAGLALRPRIAPRIDSLRKLAADVQVLREALQLLERDEFRSPKLRCLAGQVRGGAGRVRMLERLLNALCERNKDWFYHPSLLLMAGTQLCLAAEHWRMRHGAAFKLWAEAWGEFEALNALACYSFENPDHTFPELVEGEALFEAHAIGHPLLPPSCIRNDVALNGASRFYIVSGSNMSGKSTLLRAIGLNAVLAMAGAPVRAKSLRLSPQLSVCASLSVVDSVLNGTSKFLAEVDRIRKAIELAGNGRPVLFLIDEILSGTNSLDRRAAAESIVRTLVRHGAIGALSTHDLALAEITGTNGLRGVNVHMGSREGGGPMDFDYLLKPGVTKERNALDIARMMGVPVQLPQGDTSCC